MCFVNISKVSFWSDIAENKLKRRDQSKEICSDHICLHACLQSLPFHQRCQSCEPQKKNQNSIFQTFFNQILLSLSSPVSFQSDLPFAARSFSLIHFITQNLQTDETKMYMGYSVCRRALQRRGHDINQHQRYSKQRELLYNEENVSSMLDVSK